jgi:hypothetical protein
MLPFERSTCKSWAVYGGHSYSTRNGLATGLNMYHMLRPFWRLHAMTVPHITSVVRRWNMSNALCYRQLGGGVYKGAGRCNAASSRLLKTCNTCSNRKHCELTTPDMVIEATTRHLERRHYAVELHKLRHVLTPVDIVCDLMFTQPWSRVGVWCVGTAAHWAWDAACRTPQTYQKCPLTYQPCNRRCTPVRRPSKQKEAHHT